MCNIILLGNMQVALQIKSQLENKIKLDHSKADWK